MYINSIKIKNYRNYEEFYMKFKEGLNVIIGANNAGKTNLLHAINLIKDLNIDIDDFNKSNLLKKYNNDYRKESPTIEIEYEISEDDENDESIIKLLPFLGLDKINDIRNSQGDTSKYLVVANIKLKYELNKKYLKDYCELVKNVRDLNEYINCLELMQKHYEWNICNGMDDSIIDKKSISNIFKIDYIEAERNTNDVYYETKNEINKYIKEEENMKKIKDLANVISEQMEKAVKEVLQKIDKVVNEDEKNEIGLKDGNVSIKQGIKYKPDISSGYQIDVRDTTSEYIIPLSHNGVGYNNLINIYMLLKLVELRPGQDFRILCLEEPEAHLHPELQQKMARLIINMMNLGIPVWITTHSDTILQHINNMMKLKNHVRSNELQQEYGYKKADLLSREDIQMYQFVAENNGKTRLLSLEATKYGFIVPTFNNALEKIVEEVYAFQED